MVNNKMVDIAGLSRYHENLKNVLLDNLTEAKDYADGLVDGKFDEVGAAAQALADAKSYVDGKVDGKFDTAGAAAQALADAKADAASLYQVKGNYETEGAAEQALTDAKAYVDGKVDGKFDAVGSADKALADAKADAAGLYQLKGDYETAGAAAQALEAAKTYVDGLADNYDAAGAAAQALADAKADAATLYQVKGNYETAGTAAGLDAAMDARVKVLEAIDHEKLATDASAAAVATILDGAPEKFDTLKEVAEWISATDSASSAADLVTRVAALEAIDHDAYVEADKTVLESAKTYVDGKVDGKFDTAGAAAQALADAKADAESKYQVKGNYETAGAAAQALADAKADAASLYQVKGDYATNTQVSAKQDIITDLETIRSGAAAGATALQSVPAEYVTETELTGKGYLTANDLTFAEDGDIDALFAPEA